MLELLKAYYFAVSKPKSRKVATQTMQADLPALNASMWLLIKKTRNLLSIFYIYLHSNSQH